MEVLVGRHTMEIQEGLITFLEMLEHVQSAR